MRAGNTILLPPPYKLWPYERVLRLTEAGLKGLAAEGHDPDKAITVPTEAEGGLRARSLAFTHGYIEDGATRPTWQAILENGAAANPAARKDPKYVTHGLHAYKGKFYPQLAKSLLNLAALDEGALVLDPFCGSGTSLLEAYLNGRSAFGIDLNPLAAKIARAKTDILQTPPDLLTEAVDAILGTIAEGAARAPQQLTEFPEDCHDEIQKWFAKSVAYKINWLLRLIRKNSAGTVRDFLEVVLSGVIRDVSQQEPTDLRVRYRKELLSDADVLGLFKINLETQFARIEKFWRVRGWAPHQFHEVRAVHGDNRSEATYALNGLTAGSVDFVLTSPPYGTALPYIDTDRLSLLAIMGMHNSSRRPIEASLIGSREISVQERRHLESLDARHGLPLSCSAVLKKMERRLAGDPDAGFRKRNMPALMTRYLKDMDAVFSNLHVVCKDRAEAMIVIGDNRMEIGGTPFLIPTTQMVADIGKSHGFDELQRIDISVTTENLLHQKNAITENVVLRLRKGAKLPSKR